MSCGQSECLVICMEFFFFNLFSAKSLYFNSDPKSSEKLTLNRRFHDFPAGGGKH